MRTRNRLSRASSSPRSCSHANTQPPFSSFQLPEVLFACEHANTFLELPAPRSLVRMRTRGRLSGASDSPGLFAREHAGAFLELPAPRGFVRMRTREHLSGASGSPKSCSHANTRAPFCGFRLPEVLFACEHAGAFLELPAPRGFVRMRTREHLSGASGSPKSCSHANTRAPFCGFRLPEVLFACEHANTFLELPAPRSLVRMRTREHLSRASGNPRFCSHANTQPPFGGTKPSHLHPET